MGGVWEESGSMWEASEASGKHLGYGMQVGGIRKHLEESDVVLRCFTLDAQCLTLIGIALR